MKAGGHVLVALVAAGGVAPARAHVDVHLSVRGSIGDPQKIYPDDQVL